MGRNKSNLLKSQVTWRLPTAVVIHLSSLAVKKGKEQGRRVNESEILTDIVASKYQEVSTQLKEQGYEHSSI